MMTYTRRNFMLAALTLLFAGAMFQNPAAAGGDLQGKALIDVLRKGGYVIYMRHTKTDRSQKDTDISDLSNCSTQRNLNDEGREQARMIGGLFDKWGIKLDKILSSPYCRAIDTATLAFGDTDITPNLRYLTRLNPTEAETVTTWLKKQLSTKPSKGRNTILISHTANLKKGVGIWPHNSGDIYVFEPLGNGDFKLIGFMTPDQWAHLAESI